MAVAILRGCGLRFFAASQFKKFAPLTGCDGCSHYLFPHFGCGCFDEGIGQVRDGFGQALDFNGFIHAVLI